LAIFIPDTFPSQPPASLPALDPISNLEEDATDTVELSEDAQIRLLTQQGQSPGEIALNLGVAVSTIEGYLGVVVAPSPATPAKEPTRAPSPASPISAMR
jgi:hypothetical protein